MQDFLLIFSRSSLNRHSERSEESLKKRNFSYLVRVALVALLFVLVEKVAHSENEQALSPINNYGLLLIEKEMIRYKEKRKLASEGKKESYKAWLMLESYFLKKGFTPKAMKMVHQAVTMRDSTKDLKKKAFLECEAWRILDHDLKNYEKLTLIQALKTRNKFSDQDHLRFRKWVSKKVAKCIVHVRSNWMWKGPTYKDELLDIKAKHAVETARSYLILQKNVPPRKRGSTSD